MLNHQTQNICITFVQRLPNVFDVGPTLHKCYTNVLRLLGNKRVNLNVLLWGGSLAPGDSQALAWESLGASGPRDVRELWCGELLEMKQSQRLFQQNDRPRHHQEAECHDNDDPSPPTPLFFALGAPGDLSLLYRRLKRERERVRQRRQQARVRLTKLAVNVKSATEGISLGHHPGGPHEKRQSFFFKWK